MKLICKNIKNYKITLNTEYEVLEEEGNYVKVINDLGKCVRYDKNLFEEINMTPPLPPIRTENQIIESIESNLVDNFLIFSYRDRTNQLITSDPIGIEVQNPNFSCGIETINGLTEMMSIIEQRVNTEHSDYTLLKKAIFVSLINTLRTHRRSNNNRGALLFSTNNNSTWEDYYTYLTELSMTTTDWFNNPNSGNDIKIWCVNTLI